MGNETDAKHNNKIEITMIIKMETPRNANNNNMNREHIEKTNTTKTVHVTVVKTIGIATMVPQENKQKEIMVEAMNKKMVVIIKTIFVPITIQNKTSLLKIN